MGTIVKIEDGAETIEVDLRNPWLAAALSWFIPGAGQLYQRRFAKGTVFLVTVLGTFFYGMYLSNGRAVYASFRSEDVRLWYVPQLLAGGVALPAAVQYSFVSKGQAPILGGFQAPPDGEVLLEWSSEGYDLQGEPLSSHEYKKRLGEWIADPKGDFNLGTLFTVIAGLINVYVIYDAFAGPLPEKRREDEEPNPDGPKPDGPGGSGPASAASPGS
jgi:hypothetical protein